jgi:hypothetical protein
MYVIARTAKGRPTLMHKVYHSDSGFTVCGQVLWAWSRAYFPAPIPQVLCKKCAAHS